MWTWGVLAGEADYVNSILITEDTRCHEKEFGIYLGNCQPLTGFSGVESDTLRVGEREMRTKVMNRVCTDCFAPP